MKDYYRILQVAPTASPEVVRAAYEQLLLSEGPGAADPGSEARLRDLHDAFAVLGNPRKREEYDRSRGRGVGSGGITLLAALVLIVAAILLVPALRSEEIASAPAAASRTPEPPPVLPEVSPVSPDPPAPTPVVEVSPSPLVEVSPSPLAEVSPLASVPEVDGVFFFEDFSAVEVGYLPKYLPGMPDYMVDVDRDRKFMRRFQDTQGEASFLVEGVTFPRDYEIDWVARVPRSADLTCTAGQNQAGLQYSEKVWLNATAVRLDSLSDRTVKFTLRKTGPLVRLLLDGQEVALGRYAEPEVPPTAFSLTFSDDDWVLYLVRARRL